MRKYRAKIIIAITRKIVWFLADNSGYVSSLIKFPQRSDSYVSNSRENRALSMHIRRLFTHWREKTT